MCRQIFTQNISYENFIRQYPHISSTSVDLKQLKSALHNKKIVTKDIIASTTRFMNITCRIPFFKSKQAGNFN